MKLRIERNGTVYETEGNVDEIKQLIETDEKEPKKSAPRLMKPRAANKGPRFVNKYKKWTPEQDSKALSMYSQGSSYGAIARAVGRTRGGVRVRIGALTKKDPKATLQRVVYFDKPIEVKPKRSRKGRMNNHQNGFHPKQNPSGSVLKRPIRYSEADIKKIISLRREGISFSTISQIIGRDKKSVSNAYYNNRNRIKYRMNEE